jgi:trimeric autotransporter adhesin
MRTHLAVVLFTVAAIKAQTGPQYTIDTYAGSQISDGAPALGVALLPRSVTIDPAGVVHITALSVYRLGADGSLTVAAGTTLGYSGDGGPATQAAIGDPRSVTFDSAGNMYIADTSNHVLRKVDAGTGIISTIATTGEAGSTVNAPYQIVLDGGGNLYFSDATVAAIRKIVLSTGVISTVQTGFSAPRDDIRGIALDSAGNLYVANRGQHRIMKVALATGAVTTVVGTTQGYSGDSGPAINAQLSLPESVAFDAAGNLYIADTGNHRIRKVAAGSQTISTVEAGELSGLFTIALDKTGNLYIADNDNGTVRVINGGDGTIRTIAGGSGGERARHTGAVYLSWPCFARRPGKPLHSRSQPRPESGCQRNYFYGCGKRYRWIFRGQRTGVAGAHWNIPERVGRRCGWKPFYRGYE